MVTVIKQWCYTLYSSKVLFFFLQFLNCILVCQKGPLSYSVLSTALFWPVDLCFPAVLHCTLLLEPANWWITLTDDPTHVNDNVLQKELQDGKFYYETAMRHFYSVASHKIGGGEILFLTRSTSCFLLSLLGSRKKHHLQIKTVQWKKLLACQGDWMVE